MLGTSGEFPYLSDRQKAEVLTVAVAAARGRVPVLAGVLETSTRRAIDLAATARDAGADAVVAAAPFYADQSPDEIVGHFEALATSSGLPVVAYNIPSRVHTTLTPGMVERLAAAGTIVGLKDSGQDLGAFREVCALASPTFSTMTGSEHIVDAALLIGAAGAVPGLANVDPEGFVTLYDFALAGKWEDARHEQDRLARLASIITAGRTDAVGFDSAAYGGFKEALVARGVITSASTGIAAAALPPSARVHVRSALQRAGLA